MVRQRVPSLELGLLFGVASAASACATSDTAMGKLFDTNKEALSMEWTLPHAPANDFALGEYSVIDLHPKRAPERAGKTYGFSVAHADATASAQTDQSVLLWTVTGVGGIGVRPRELRITVTELVEIKRPGSKDAAWTMEIFSGHEYQLQGSLKGKDITYEVDSVPLGTLLLGENYGARLVCFLHHGEIVAAVDIASPNAKVMIRSSLGDEERSVFAAAGAAIALRSYVLGATGSALKYVMRDQGWIQSYDCGGDLACQIAEQDAISMGLTAARSSARRTGR